jgi:hypothetical protein
VFARQVKGLGLSEILIASQAPWQEHTFRVNGPALLSNSEDG